MSLTPSLEHCASLQVVSSLDALMNVITWFERLDWPLMDASLRIEAQTALIEGFTNVVQHAHGHLPVNTPIQIAAQVNGSMLQIMIWDQGQPYDFAAAMHQLSISPDQAFNPLTREQHWGQVLFLRLSRERGWRFMYDRLPDERNRLLMEKKLESEFD
ncbi:MAG: anti-sigma regulatory factor [Acaryochloridaceae cyanobacterium SU_2_1]|nr:anti-sigma regulatory factor [Acaryochloridaceae cyanobacterium SU_2_1]